MELSERIDSTSAIPKYLQVVNAIIADIEDGVLKRGERVPSINVTSETYYLARDTVERGYKELRRRGVINSVQGKGYYISNTVSLSKIRILLLFNKISAYKKTIYYSILKTLGEDAVVDLHIHHSSGKICEDIIQQNLGKYNYYVIMPHFYSHIDEALRAIKTISESKLVLLDKNLEGYKGSCTAVYQDFKRDIRNALHSGEDLLCKYKKLILVYPVDVQYPPEIVQGFKHFCRETSFEFNVVSRINEEAIEEKTVYIVLEDSDLAQLIKQSRLQGLILGKDIGIISYNDTSLKEILAEGITVISTDHEKMGETAAYMMKHKIKERIENPFTLIRRNSL